jgi:hypothetical protein
MYGRNPGPFRLFCLCALYVLHFRSAVCLVYHINLTMGVVKETLTAGDGKNFPKKGDKLTMHYQ